jgi:hypothetical protein
VKIFYNSMINDISNGLLKAQNPECSQTLKSPKILLLLVLWLSAVVLSSNAMAQSLSKAADLKANPAPEAKTVKSVAANVSVKLIKRQGFWVEVSADGVTGWIKLSDVNMSASGPSLSAVDTGRTGKSNIVSTSAARGLSDKELTSAKPDAQQFEQLRALSVKAVDAENFAQAAGLKSRTVALLAPPPVSAAVAEGGSPSARSKVAKPADDDEDD